MIKVVRRSLAVAFFFGLTLLVGVTGQALALTGSFSCLGKNTFSVNVGTAAAPQWVTAQITELMHLNVGATSGFGTISMSYAGEVCNFTVTALTMTLNATGQGTLSLSFNANVTDADRDPNYNCGLVLFGRTPTGPTTPITENYLVTTAATNTKFFFMGNDDFIVGGTGDKGDFVSLGGECDHQ